ncbi:hypothetical protein [Flavitalea sp.]|nr:hypothetical protein [Flavitalea sp.]
MKTNLPEPGRKIFFSLISVIIVGFFSTESYSQCSAPTLKFHSPVLISGTDKQVGAIYLFAEVIPGVDAHIEIAGIYGGATLYNIDDSAGIGYYDAFQPYVGAAANDTSYLDWKITFKIGGTDSDTALACLAVTGVDVDGDGAYLQEFIEAATPGSIAVDPATILNVSFDGVRSKAISTIYNIPLIDSSHHEAMFQMNFVNISTLLYRNGAVSTYGAEQIRQTCIYFKPFFTQSTFVVLPAKILSFSAQTTNGNTDLRWVATNEKSLVKYTVQKSTDGIKWTDLQSLKPGVAANTNSYIVTDHETNLGEVFYRLKEINIRGLAEFSHIIRINSTKSKKPSIVHSTFINNDMNLQIAASKNDNYLVQYFNSMGSGIQQERFSITAGINSRSIKFPSSLSSGTYYMVISNQRGEKIYSAKLVK